MRSIFLYIIMCIGLPAIAQTKDSSYCECGYSLTISYPKMAEKNKISGDVVVEMDLNENCTLSNPKVIKGVGYGCDEEAICSVQNMISIRNKCVLKQRCKDCKKGKITKTIRFSYSDD